jgi:NAD(P)-dependent dehydrogenase (short-subunit alcohol dehydrogenase family)
VLVTGASRGIGRAIALELAGAGLSVFAGVRRAEDGRRLEEAAPGRVRSLALDVADDASIEAARREVEAATGEQGLAGLVNNAGVATPGPLAHVTRAELEAQFRVNLFGALLTTRALLPLLARAGGRIVNVGAANARLALPLMGVLSATKFALEAASDALRVELRRSGIRVALVEPGMTYAEEDKEGFAAHLAAELHAALARLPEDARDYYAPAFARLRAFNGSALSRAAPPERVARAVLHALTARRPRARYWCGLDAKVAALVGRFAGAGLRDAIWRRTLGL